MCVHVHIYLCICVCVYMDVHMYHYDWEQQWANWVVSLPTLLSPLHAVMHLLLGFSLLFDFSLSSTGRF